MRKAVDGRGRRGSCEDGLMRGTVMKLARKCGKQKCRCNEGKPHTTWVLSYSQRGQTRMIPLKPSDVAEVRQAVRRYKKALADLEAEAQRGIKALRRRIQQQKGRRSPRK
jgi:hypothetical protein